MKNIIRKESVLMFINSSFNCIPENKLQSISELQNPILIQSIISEFDENFFKDLALLPDETESNRNYNMTIIYQRIQNFFQYVIKNQLDSNYFKINDTSDINLCKLGQLIVAISAQCEKREYYLSIMTNLSENISNELMQILIELIPVDENEEKPKSETNNAEDEDKENENTMLWFRVENAEKECLKLTEEIQEMQNKITDLTRQNYTYELNLKESEAKYNELIATVERKESENIQNNQNEYEFNINLSIQLSELKGKLEAKEKSFNELKNRTEQKIEDLNNQITALRKENGTLKENSVKYEVLKKQMKKISMEDMYAIKQRLLQSERSNKEKEEEIKRLKSMDDRSILLKKIEELNSNIVLLEEKLNAMKIENNTYRMKIVQSEGEINQLREQKRLLLDEKNNGNNDNNSQEQTGITLGTIVNEENKKKYEEELKIRILELETKMDILIKDKDNLTKEKNNLTEELEKNKKLLTEQNSQIDKLNKKIEKYSQFKKENQTFISKITDLMDKVEEAKNEYLNLQQAKTSMESQYNETINNITKDLNEYKLKVKELENKLEISQKENSKFEEFTKNNQIYINSLQNKSDNTQIDTKLIEMENKLKQLTENENADLKKQLKEKEDLIKKQNDRIRKVDQELKDLNNKIGKVPGEMQKRDEAIEYYKNQLEQKEKLHNEEIRLLSSIYHQLSFKCAKIKEQSKNPKLNLKDILN